MNTLSTAVSRAALAMASAHIETLARAVEHHDGYDTEVHSAALGAVAHHYYRVRAGWVLDAWATEPAVPGTAVALALRAAQAAGEAAAAHQRVEIVWTGPTTPQAPVRRTDVGLGDVIAAANSSLVLVSFAAYRVPNVVDALGAACDRGVAVTLVLESADAGVLTYDAADAFVSLRDRIRVLVWPLDRRVVGGEGSASLHAKCAVADDHTALVTSANLTGAALSHNMELGLLVRGGEVPRRLAAMWQSLATAGVLTEA